MPRRSAALLLILCCACSRPPSAASERGVASRCDAAVDHMNALIVGVGGAPPGEAEAAIIAATRQLSLTTCAREGLSEAQARCILDLEDARRMDELGRCPAIAERQPSWLILPPTAP